MKDFHKAIPTQIKLDDRDVIKLVNIAHVDLDMKHDEIQGVYVHNYNNKYLSIRSDELELYEIDAEELHGKHISALLPDKFLEKTEYKIIKELKKAVDRSQAYNVPLFFTVNEHYYIEEQLPLVKDYIQKAVDAGVRGLIISDYGLMAALPELSAQVDIHISTGGTVFNWRTASFYREMGASRITFPRHLTLKEIKEIVKHQSGLETTAFIFNSRCINVDGFCTFQHGLADQSFKLLYENACMLPYDISVATGDEIEEEQISWRRQHIWQTVHVDDYPCGACALHELNEMAITSVKIVGRGNPTARKITDVVFIRSLLDFLESEKPTRERFYGVARELYQKTYNRPCRVFMCYFPEVLI